MSKRKSVYLEGYAHANPVPVASIIGPFLFSGVITGRDAVSREMPDDMAGQCANVFAHIRELMNHVEASTDDIAKITCYLANYRDRDALNEQWLDMFPDPANRPARQVLAATLDGGALIHCDVTAVLPTEMRLDARP